MDQLPVNGIPNPAFIREKNSNLTLHPVRFVDTIFPVYKQNKRRLQKTTSLFATEDFLNWPNEKSISLGMVDTCYSNFVPFTMDDFEWHFYRCCWNGLNPYPRIEIKFNQSSVDTVQGKNPEQWFWQKLCEAIQVV